MTVPLSIGLFTYSTLPRGSVVHTANLADALSDDGHDVTVYALDKDGRGFFRPLRACLRLVPASPAPDSRRGRSSLAGPSPSREVRNPSEGSEIDSTAALVRLRAEELSSYLIEHRWQHDIYHAQDCLSASGLLSARARGHDLALTRTVHHVEAFEDPYLTECQTRSIREADCCLTVSQAARRDVREQFGVESTVVGNGVDAARFRGVARARLRTWRTRLGRGAPLVLAVGGVEERKNTLRIVGAFTRLRERWPEARLVLLGGATVLDHGAYRAAFDRACAALPAAVRAAIIELGVVAEDDVPALLQLADVMALPSLHEGFGLAALEALAAGLPLVASDRPPFTEYLDQSCAVLVDPESEAAIAAGLHAALRWSPARRRAGRRAAAERSWTSVARRHADIYQRMRGASDGPPRPPLPPTTDVAGPSPAPYP